MPIKYERYKDHSFSKKISECGTKLGKIILEQRAKWFLIVCGNSSGKIGISPGD